MNTTTVEIKVMQMEEFTDLISSQMATLSYSHSRIIELVQAYHEKLESLGDKYNQSSEYISEQCKVVNRNDRMKEVFANNKMVRGEIDKHNIIQYELEKEMEFIANRICTLIKDANKLREEFIYLESEILGFDRETIFYYDEIPEPQY